MNKLSIFTLAFASASLLALPTAHAANMSKDTYKADKALADAKLGKQIGAAQTDAAETKRDAEYKVATEKCESLAGDPKSSCMAAAKARFGKS